MQKRIDIFLYSDRQLKNDIENYQSHFINHQSQIGHQRIDRKYYCISYKKMSKFISKNTSEDKQQINDREDTIQKILTIKDINQKIKKIQDINQLQTFIELLANQIPKVTNDKDSFTKFAKRLVEAINFLLQNSPHDKIQAQSFIRILKIVRKNWKIVLHNHFLGTFTKNNMKNERFFLTLNKNEYFYYLFKCQNTLMQRQIFRMLKTNHLNSGSIAYLKNNNIGNYWFRIHEKMVKIAKDNQNQTYLKIQLINQFIKHTMLQVNFCVSSNDFDQVFNKIIQLVLYNFRLIKKFYSQEIFRLIKQFKQILVKFLSIYRVVFISQPCKLNYLTNLFNLLQNKKGKRKKSLLLLEKRKKSFTKEKIKINEKINTTNPKAFAIKLAFRILDNWKKVKSKKLKLSQQKKKQQINIDKNLSFSHSRKLKDQKQKKQQLLENLHQQQLALRNKMKRSISLNHLKPSQIQTINKIRIRKQIQDQFDKQFGRLNYLKSSERQNKQAYLKKSSLSKGRSQRSFKLLSSQLKRKSSSFKNALGLSMSQRKLNQSGQIQTQIKIQDLKQKLNIFAKQKNFSTKNRNLYHVDRRKSASQIGNMNENSILKSQQTNKTIFGKNETKMKLKL